jgi:hypothetical protein
MDIFFLAALLRKWKKQQKFYIEIVLINFIRNSFKLIKSFFFVVVMIMKFAVVDRVTPFS